jgi:hypothetical protein
MQDAILVYLDLDGTPIKVGQLWDHYRHGRESLSFEYDRNWLQHPHRFPLDKDNETHTYLEIKDVGLATSQWNREAITLRIKKKE